MKLTDLFSPAAIAAVWEETGSNRVPYLGSALFPARKKAGLDLSWIKGAKGLPVSLMPSAFDAKATFRDRIGVEKIETEMPFFREGIHFSEKDRQEIMRAQDSNDPYVTAILDRIYDDATNLIEGAEVVAERMRMSLLFPVGGDIGISIKANGVDYTYDYDPTVGGSKRWKTNNYTALAGNSLWTATSTADPFANIKTVKDSVRARTGAEITKAVMNTYTFNLLFQIAAVKNRFLSTNGTAVGYISDDDIRRVFRDMNRIEFVVYDKQYKNESGTTASFVPNGHVALIPDGPIGQTWYGTTPEEADLLSGNSDAKVSIVNTGVAVTQILNPHPVNLDTYASEIILPSYERMDECALLKVIS